MVKRYRKVSAPGFNVPTPHKPTTGEYQKLVVEGIHPSCAMMQVAAEDTHDDYVICRGYDPRIKRFIDYEEGDANKPGIVVAKPYGARGRSNYAIGEVHAAFLPYCHRAPLKTPLLQNPGKAESTTGHPADLDEELTFLLSTGGVYVNWMLVDSAPALTLVEMCLAENHPGRGVVFESYMGAWSPDDNKWIYEGTTKYKCIDWRYGMPYPDAGGRGLFQARPSTEHEVIYDCVSLDCESPGDCDD